MNKKNLRQTSRKKRQSLSVAEQYRAAHSIFKKISRHPYFIQAKNIAFYLAADGEISPHFLMRHAMQKGKLCFLPALNKRDVMVFRRYKNRGELKANKFGIPEPQARCQEIDNRKLDLVLMPLVAFDARGNRIGMGGGYYDRCFAWKRGKLPLKPKLLGLAHNCQRSPEEITADEWDVKMDGIVTDKAIIARRR